MDADLLEALLHDLKGPVSRMRMLGELLVRRSDALDEEARTLISHIGSSASTAEGVLDALRRYADVVQLPFQSHRFDLGLAVRSAISHIENQLRHSGGSVTHAGLPEIDGDPAQLTVLFQELIANSIQNRSDQAPKVMIGARPAETYWTISISDNGRGLGQMDPRRIFRPFAKTPDRPRPGIGLAICRLIARRHAGEMASIPAESGAEFHLLLPR